jgi:hypothetical protein
VVATGVGPVLAADGSGVYVVRPAGPGSPGRQSIERVASGRVPELVLRRTGQEIAAMAVDDGVLAFVTATWASSGGRIEVVDTRTRTARTTPLAGSGRSTSLALCDGRLHWSEAAMDGLGATVPTFVLDVSSGDLARIDVDDAFGGPFCSGDRLAWRQLGSGVDASASTVVVRWNE